MNRFIKIFLFIVINFWGCTIFVFAQNQPSKGKLFIIGGGHKPQSMVKQIIGESGITPAKGYGIVLPMASSVPDTSAYYGMKQFRDLGIRDIHAFNFADSSLSGIQAKLDSLIHATFIYIPGGVQSQFMKAVHNTPGLDKAIHDAYHDGALVAGTSAGAAVMSEIMITGDQKKYPEYTPTFFHIEHNNIITARGLSLITDVIVDQHFVKRARNNRLLTAVMEYPDRVGIGIDESTAIIVEGNKVKVVGESQVLVYRNQSDSSEAKDGKLAAKDINLSIYLPGESFQIR
ncbi:MAG: cyanophycinase [Balneolaceae bacterium]|jgi:cyanophycinase